jgi:hypothetical protein
VKATHETLRTIRKKVQQQQQSFSWCSDMYFWLSEGCRQEEQTQKADNCHSLQYEAFPDPIIDN